MMIEARLMSTVRIDLEEGLAALLHQTNRPIQEAAREMIVLELYRRGTVSSGKAAELLGMPRLEFIRHASRLGIPHIDMTPDEWEAEKAVLDTWPRS
jgi:predicted HTH domain antitoxin